MDSDLTPAEMLEAAAAFAEMHRWAAPAWRYVAAGKATRATVLENAADMIARLEELRDFLRKSETNGEPERR